MLEHMLCRRYTTIRLRPCTSFQNISSIFLPPTPQPRTLRASLTETTNHNVLYNLRTYLLHGAKSFEKLTGSQLVKEFPAFYAHRRFVTSFTRAHHLSLSVLHHTIAKYVEASIATESAHPSIHPRPNYSYFKCLRYLSLCLA